MNAAAVLARLGRSGRTARSRRSRAAYAVAVGASAFVLAACGAAGAEGQSAGEQVAPSASEVGAETSMTAPAESAASAARQVTITAADLPPITPAANAATSGPQRIVSLATGVGETLVALGVGDRVVGRDETSEVPTGAEVVTKAHEVSAEKVLSLNPDLVIVDARTSPPEAIDQIRAAGVSVIDVPEAWTLQDIAPRTEAVAAAVGADATEVLGTLPTADPTTSTDGPRVAFLYLRGTSAIYLLGGAGSGADAMIAAAGGTDVGAAAGLDPFVPLTAEALVALDPQVLLVMTKGLESVNGIDGLLELPGVAQTAAGQERRVVAVDDEILLSFGPRTGALVELLREALSTVSS